MLKRFAHIVLSCWLALLLLFGGTPKEFIHLFASHTDTEHVQHQPGVLSFESEHHHCSFLSFSLPPFVQQDAIYVIAATNHTFPEFYECLQEELFSCSCIFISLRGPPALC